MIFVSTKEPKEFWGIGKPNDLTEKFGSDFLFSSKSGLVGIQRKKFPEDFLASLRGGDRVARELEQMRKLALGIWVLEGYGAWTNEGYLVYGGRYKYYLNEYWGFLLSLQAYLGYPVIVTGNSLETYRFVEQTYRWANKPEEHGSLFRRNKPQSSEEWEVFFLQGIPGIGRGTAQKIVQYYNGVPVVLQDVAEDLSRVIGPHKAGLIRDCLKGVERKDAG